jgi:protein-S-isoprenylcysteine O-methyltransferase Ste14
MQSMRISEYEKHFGIGPIAFLTGFFLLALLLLADKKLGHVEILNQPQPIRIMGFILIGLWICWQSWTIKTIRSWWRNGRLCTSGPFRFVRHPMYAGGLFLAGLGTVLLFNSWIMLLWPMLLYPIWSILVRKEEDMMTAIFAEDYKRYASHTGRFIPGVARTGGRL